MTTWVRFSKNGIEGFGTLDGDIISMHTGDMFAGSSATGTTLALADVTLLAPCRPSKMPALWNNFHERAAKEGNPLPADPLYFLKSNNSFCAPGNVIRKPAHFDGKVIFEAELGIVIGERGLKEGLIEYQGRRDKEAQRIALADCAAFLLGRLQS